VAAVAVGIATDVAIAAAAGSMKIVVIVVAVVVVTAYLNQWKESNAPDRANYLAFENATADSTAAIVAIAVAVVDARSAHPRV
jgi:hypothetical protein